ncbi:MAG: hypothetical protein NTX09_01090 [Verrucomicrobia bacterium]|nr:hypothetical protein [Verrucomicrobiota bacterium]
MQTGDAAANAAGAFADGLNHGPALAGAPYFGFRTFFIPRPLQP